MAAPLERDRAQLAEHYRSLNELELARLAGEGAALTDLAREVLANEIARRNLSLGIASQASTANQLTERPIKLVTIRAFRDLAPALLAKTVLDEAGIESFLADDNIVRMDWFWSYAMGGVKLRVKIEDAPKANEVLGEDSLELPEDEDVSGSSEQS